VEGLRGFGVIRVIVVPPPERREVPAEVQFEVAPYPVTEITDLRAARLRTWQGQQWEEQVDARLKLGSCRRPEPIETEKYDPSLPLAFAIARLFEQPIEDIFVPGDDKSAG